MQTVYFGGRQKSSQPPTRVAFHASGGVGREATGLDRVIQYLQKYVERTVRAARRCLAVVIEPSVYGCRPYLVEPQSAKGRNQLRPQSAVHALACRRFTTKIANCLPRSLNEVLKRQFCSPSPAHYASDDLNRILGHPVGEMGVPERRLRVAMPEQTADRHHRFALVKRETGVRMTQIV